MTILHIYREEDITQECVIKVHTKISPSGHVMFANGSRLARCSSTVNCSSSGELSGIEKASERAGPYREEVSSDIGNTTRRDSKQYSVYYGVNGLLWYLIYLQSSTR